MGGGESHACVSSCGAVTEFSRMDPVLPVGRTNTHAVNLVAVCLLVCLSSDRHKRLRTVQSWPNRQLRIRQNYSAQYT